MSTKKSDFGEKLEKLVGSDFIVSSVSEPDCIVFDAMAIVQMLHPSKDQTQTYIQMASGFWSYILKSSLHCKQIHVVFDRYLTDSLKSKTRRKRGNTAPVAMLMNMLIPDWKKVLTRSKSKNDLIKLFTRYLTENCHNLLETDEVIFVPGGMDEKFQRVCCSAVSFVYQMESSQEEADDALCPQQPNGVFRFGPKCGFMCHCRNNAQCDDTTGECASGCASFWYGPGCQYRDIAEGEFSRQSDDLQRGQEKFSILAHDNDPTTCSYTADVQSTSKTNIKPFWRVWLPTNETISEIQIVTLPDKLRYFKSFKIYVEYVSIYHKNDNSYMPSHRQKCYQHSSDAPNSETFTVLCNNSVVGNHVRIELVDIWTQLVLCDVKINGGRNLAFGRYTSQISTQEDCRRPDECISDNSVDGIDSSRDWRHCSFTDHGIDPWWEVDLGQKAIIQYIRISPISSANSADYQVELSNDTHASKKPVYDVNVNPYVLATITLNTEAKIIHLTRTGPGRLEVCEVNVFGDCLEDICGYDCTKECHCKDANVWDKIAGKCSSGCKGRWIGPKCDKLCETTHWGSFCENICGHCANSEPCDLITGLCPSGCQEGYALPNCSTRTVCTSGFYGESCGSTCDRHCVGGTCEREDGRCTNGCFDGWIGMKCDRRCKSGLYGKNCSRQCSKYCKYGNGRCSHENGHCQQGCKAGWKGDTCDQECEDGTFGIYCQTNCSGNCKNDEVCEKVYGSCPNGCKPGYLDKLCARGCRPSFYGINCSSKCSEHCNGGYAACSKVNGSCLSGCHDGWNGHRCDRSIILRKLEK
ncbi:uncharacterized protein LOC128557383 [Mercenaria mercenaria]|uniref:uncharacterized protein LOC128557383 n=1 Tax=Mercenaria mercenaria TaxID=6596 RepID=UPI00234F97B0|nr:uncharacterized protein LOC128557383 [Mercenaria mercenaria]